LTKPAHLTYSFFR